MTTGHRIKLKKGDVRYDPETGRFKRVRTYKAGTRAKKAARLVKQWEKKSK